ncbi:alpha/beta hydrolase family protein [Algimonas porphyrae]|uniref:Prolyl oligopeptidase n=2 Tax=Algimonas porphyrae TaxID=1128113 RepID=A0ABQ5V2U2_9PROT|nr:S9 family peptidase [Algimonas porphyrae]GLQ21793.1 prolyl oligopeptidase [Algimonas porphyrae]
MFPVTLALASIALAGPPSARDFAMKRTAMMMEMSPEGGKVAYIARSFETICRTTRLERLPPERCKPDERVSAPVDRLLVKDITDPSMPVLRKISIPDDYKVNWLEWSSPDTLLMSIETRWVIGARYYRQPIGRILAIKLDGSKLMSVLFGEEEKLRDSNVKLSGVVDLLPDDPDHVVMGARRNGDYDLFKVNIDDGTAERIAKGHPLTIRWFTNKQHKPAVRMDCATNTCREIKVHRLSDGEVPENPDAKWGEVLTLEVEQRGDEEVQTMTWVAAADHPDQFYVEVEGEDQSHRAIKIFDVRTNRFVKDVFSDPDHDVGGTLINAKTGDYAGAYLWRDRLEYHLVDTDLQTHMDRVNAHFGDRANVIIAGFSEDRRRALAFVSAPNDPGGYYIYEFDDQSLTQIVSAAEAIPSELPSRTDIVSIPTRDGQAITGYHTRPLQNGEPVTAAPLIVLVHGGPESRDYFDYDRDVQFLTSRGYQLLQINFRGSSGYGRTFAEAGYRQWAGTMHDDVIDATRFMVSSGHATPDRTCIMGHSYGGYAALFAGAKRPDLFACVIAGSGVSDLYQSLKDDRRTYGKNSSTFEYWTKSIGDMKTDRAELEAASPVNLASRFDDPVLLVHGEYDRIVDLDQSTKMQKALERAGKSVEKLVLPVGHRHDSWSIEVSTTYFERLEAFLGGVFPETTAAN